MATDIPEVRTRLLQERAVVVALLVAVDMADEEARFAAAEAELAVAVALHGRKTKRWNLIQEKVHRLEFLDDQIATVTP